MSLKTNTSYWTRKSQEYPFHVKEDVNGPLVPFTTVFIGGAPQDRVTEDVEYTRDFGHFIRVPFRNQVRWGFLSEDGATRFIERFGGTRV